MILTARLCGLLILALGAFGPAGVLLLPWPQTAALVQPVKPVAPIESTPWQPVWCAPLGCVDALVARDEARSAIERAQLAYGITSQIMTTTPPT